MRSATTAGATSRTAEIALLLAEMGHDVTGYDIAPRMLSKAREKAHAAGVPARFARGDAYDLPLADGSVDVVVSRMVFWTLHDPARALREWRRVLAPGGRVVVIDALHFAAPRTVAQRASRVRSRIFWEASDQLERAQGLRQRRHSSRRGQYHSDAVKPPGMHWRSVADAQRHFADAGLSDVTPAWLEAVAAADRRTAPLRWRLRRRGTSLARRSPPRAGADRK